MAADLAERGRRQPRLRPGPAPVGYRRGFVADIPFGQALAVLCGWAVVGVLLAVWGLQIRDP